MATGLVLAYLLGPIPAHGAASGGVVATGHAGVPSKTATQDGAIEFLVIGDDDRPMEGATTLVSVVLGGETALALYASQVTGADGKTRIGVGPKASGAAIRYHVLKSGYVAEHGDIGAVQDDDAGVSLRVSLERAIPVAVDVEMPEEIEGQDYWLRNGSWNSAPFTGPPQFATLHAGTGVLQCVHVEGGIGRVELESRFGTRIGSTSVDLSTPGGIGIRRATMDVSSEVRGVSLRLSADGPLELDDVEILAPGQLSSRPRQSGAPGAGTPAFMGWEGVVPVPIEGRSRMLLAGVGFRDTVWEPGQEEAVHLARGIPASIRVVKPEGLVDFPTGLWLLRIEAERRGGFPPLRYVLLSRDLEWSLHAPFPGRYRVKCKAYSVDLDVYLPITVGEASASYEQTIVVREPVDGEPPQEFVLIPDEAALSRAYPGLLLVD